MSESGESRAMPERRIFPLTSSEGYGAVVHGNFITIRIGMRGFYASVSALLSDANYQRGEFDNAIDAVAWAVATAGTHQGQPNRFSKTEYWEIRNGYSIAVEPDGTGGYQAETHPLWVDTDPGPIRNFKTFPGRGEAIRWARQSADEQAGYDAEYERSLQQIRASLEAHSG